MPRITRDAGQHVDREAVRSALMAVMAYAENPPVISGNLPLSPRHSGS